MQDAVAKKAPASASAGATYLWAEYALDGRPVISLTGKGAIGSCVSCHSTTPNRDLMLTFDLH